MSDNGSKLVTRTIDGKRVRMTEENAALVDLQRQIDKQKPKTDEEDAAFKLLRQQAIAEAIKRGVDKLEIDEPGMRRITVTNVSKQPWESLDLEACRDLDARLFRELFSEKTVWAPTERLDMFLRMQYSPDSPQGKLQAALVRAKRAKTTWHCRTYDPTEIECRHCGATTFPVKNCPVCLCAECVPLYNMQAIHWEIGRGELRPTTFNNRRSTKRRASYLLKEKT